jgi:hypothetical protein
MIPTDPKILFPHNKLVAYQLALEFVRAVARTRIADAHIRQQAHKSASSCALNLHVKNVLSLWYAVNTQRRAAASTAARRCAP